MTNERGKSIEVARNITRYWVNQDVNDGTKCVEYHHEVHNITVFLGYTRLNYNWMTQYHGNLDEFDDNLHANPIAWNFDLLYQAIKQIVPEYDGNDGFSAIIRNPDTMINGVAQLKRDYSIFKGKFDYLAHMPSNMTLKCAFNQLRFGDVTRSNGLVASPLRLYRDMRSQGYYTQEIIGGERYEKFLVSPESVATWNGNLECWILNKE